MFCPKCATQNLDGASFCRTCGANISLVPQALTGQIIQAPPPAEEVVDESCSRRNRKRELTLDVAFKNMFIGVAFLIISLALSRTIGAGWWFWMLIPAFSLMGSGFAQFIRLREKEKRMWMGQTRVQPVLQRQEPVGLPRRTDELRPPAPSVTEGTTRHLGVEAPTRHLEAQERK
jgi:hypothetical protein